MPRSTARIRCIGPTGCGRYVGWRGDYYNASINSELQPANSGKSIEAIGSPKFRMEIGPFDKTELFIGAGMGYHSNDARSTTVTQVPGDPSTPESSSPFLVRSRGAEVGIRTKAIPNLDSSISLFYLHQDSELFFDGDTGDTIAGLPSQRTGIEFTNDYRLQSWLHIDANLALSRARFLGFDSTQEALYQSLAGYPQAQIGNAPGNFVYNAPWMIASAGITLGEKTGWFSDLRWRYISSRPLTEDGVFQSPPFNVINAGVGYRFDNGWRIQLDALNLLNSTTDLATYAYGSLLTTDALYKMCTSGAPPPAAVCANGVMDYIYHPVEPLAFRLTLAGPLETIDTINIAAMAAEMKRSFPAAPLRAGDLRLDRVPCRRACGQCLVQHQRQHRQYRDRRRVRSHLRQRTGVARRHSARLRLHDAVAHRARRRGRRVVRRQENNDHYRRFGHQRRSDHGL